MFSSLIINNQDLWKFLQCEFSLPVQISEDAEETVLFSRRKVVPIVVNGRKVFAACSSDVNPAMTELELKTALCLASLLSADS